MLASVRAVIDSTPERLRTSQHAWDSTGHAASPLSHSERGVLALVAAGATAAETSATLGLSVEAVDVLLARAYRKLGARGLAEAVAAAYERSLL
jgi:DNA-binding CsgD family transcriptional regulator